MLCFCFLLHVGEDWSPSRGLCHAQVVLLQKWGCINSPAWATGLKTHVTGRGPALWTYRAVCVYFGHTVSPCWLKGLRYQYCFNSSRSVYSRLRGTSELRTELISATTLPLPSDPLFCSPVPSRVWGSRFQERLLFMCLGSTLAVYENLYDVLRVCSS